MHRIVAQVNLALDACCDQLRVQAGVTTYATRGPGGLGGMPVGCSGSTPAPESPTEHIFMQKLQ